VMTILLALGTSTAGVSVTVIVTPCALATWLLSVIAGLPVPKQAPPPLATPIAGKVPSSVGAHPLRAVPVGPSKDTFTLLSAACAAVGLLKPEMVNVTGSPEGNEPALRVTVIVEPLSETDAAAPDAGNWNAMLGLVIVNPPDSVMTILLALGTSTAGVSVTVIVTPCALATWLLSVIAGLPVPKHACVPAQHAKYTSAVSSQRTEQRFLFIRANLSSA